MPLLQHPHVNESGKEHYNRGKKRQIQTTNAADFAFNRRSRYFPQVQNVLNSFADIYSSLKIRTLLRQTFPAHSSASCLKNCTSWQLQFHTIAYSKHGFALRHANQHFWPFRGTNFGFVP